LAKQFHAEREGAAGWGGVRHEDAVGKGGDEPVSFFGKLDCDSAVFGAERRENQQAAGAERGRELGFETHSRYASRGHPDHRLAAPKQNAQTLPFHGGVKAADYDLLFVPDGCDDVEGLQDYGAGTL
jgi:hypothetical protein